MTIDGTLVIADEEARIAALDVTRSFIVQAPAGSGKTELLIQRYLRLLAVVDEPEEVVAITFTRKAAAEMRERVVDALLRAAAGGKPEKAYEQVTHAAARDALRRDETRGWSLAQNFSRMRIQTLDAMCAGIARLLPVTSGMGTAGRVLENYEIAAVYDAAALATLDWLPASEAPAAAVRTVLSHLDNNTPAYVRYLSRMLQARDQWLDMTGSGQGIDKLGIRESLEKNIRDIIRHRLATVRRRVLAAAPDGWVALAAFAGSNLCAAGRDDEQSLALAALDSVPDSEPECLAVWQGVSRMLLTGQGTWRRTLTRNDGFPADRRDEKSAWLDVIAALGRSPGLDAQMNEIQALPPPAYSDAQWDVLKALFAVLPLAVSELRRLFAERGVCDHAEVALSAATALGSAESPGDAALMLDYRIRHLLVDEMQDTSIAQYRLLETLTAGWAPGDGRSFFCVGDPMQSIYRFRNAEVGQFVRARSAGLAHLPLESLTLRRNFRSGENLVAWFNAVFSRVLSDEDDPATGAVSYSSSVPVPPLAGSGHVSLHALRDADTMAEAIQTAQIVKACLDTSSGEDIAVLVRSRTQLPDVLAEMRRCGIAYEAIEIDRLTDLPEIIDITAIARALAHPGDRAAWLAVLRGPLVGLDWTDLHALVFDAADASIPDLLDDPDRLQSLSAFAVESLDRFRTELTAAQAVDRVLGLRERVERLWLRLGGAACLRNAAEVDNVYRFLELVERLERAGTIPDPAVLRQHLDAERVSSPAADDCRVTVMTMHKAKGLQFDHVILPLLGRYTSGAERSVLSWLNVPADSGGSDLVLSPVGPSYELERDPLHNFIERARAASDRLELDRLLYVACTRARKSLHLAASLTTGPDGEEFRAPHAGSLLSRLWPCVGDEMQAAAARSETRTANDDDVLVMPVLRRLQPGWSLPDIEPLPADPDRALPIDESREVHFDWVGAAARHAGTIVHRWLHRIVRDGLLPGDLDEDRVRAASAAWARDMGVPDEEIGRVVSRAVRAIAAVAVDDRGLWILSGDGHAEFALTGVVKGRIRSVVIDRIRIDAGVHWIIDYKTSTHEGGDPEGFLRQEEARYRDQLSRYAAIYGAWSKAASIRAALYFPLLQAFREIDVSGNGG